MLTLLVEYFQKAQPRWMVKFVCSYRCCPGDGVTGPRVNIDSDCSSNNCRQRGTQWCSGDPTAEMLATQMLPFAIGR